MRIWDVPVADLCRRHLLGEHRELHGLWNILTLGKKGYSHHPETRRWDGKLGALRRRHDDLVAEMVRRGYRHQSPLPPTPIGHSLLQFELINTLDEQRQLLADKNCPCYYQEHM
ncbi:MAG: pyrimidine dimer DNA glycosylase/endonuclease V [Nitrospira sp.]